MALCSLSPSTNRRLISHSWTSPSAEVVCTYWVKSYTHVPATAVFTPTGCLQKSEQKGHTQMILISENQSNKRTYTHTCTCRHTHTDGLRSTQQIKWHPLTWCNMQEEASWTASRHKTLFVTRPYKSQSFTKKQTSTWPAKRTHPISPDLTFTAY